MQLHQNIPTLGGLTPDAPGSRRELLAQEGEAAQRQVAALLARARRRAAWLEALRGVSLVSAGLLVALLAGALVASVDGTLFARLVLAALSLAASAAAGWLVWRASPLDPRQLARRLGGPSELLSSVELSADPPAGASTELLSLLHVRAAAAAAKIDPAKALPASSLRPAILALAGTLLFWAFAHWMAPRHVSQGLRRLWSGDSGAPPVEPSPIAGDLSITYLYPAYTGLPPRTEEGTAGDLRAPRGTEVRIAARADRDLSQAFAVVNGTGVELEATGPGHRQLAGTFALLQAGQWN